jgi:DNA polymerase-3 subunit delta
MKLSGRDSLRFCRAPDQGLKAALLYGPDAATVATARRELVAALAEGDDLRITRLDGPAVRRDPASLDTAIRARGFFPGRRVVVVETARDELTEIVKDALRETEVEDGFLVLEAGALAAKSSLRKLFEQSRDAAACGLYPDPPDGAEIVAMLRSAGMRAALDREAEAALAAFSADFDRPQVIAIIEKIALFSGEREAPLTLDEVSALLPAAPEAELDQLINAVAAGRAQDVAPLLGRFAAGGAAPVQAMILTGRHFRQLHALVAAEDGVDAALARLRPPLFGPRRAAMLRQASAWSRDRVEAVLRLLQDTDRTLRSPGTRPDRALVERCLIRIAMMGVRR